MELQVSKLILFRLVLILVKDDPSQEIVMSKGWATE